jgi:hypothetical protein
LTEKWVTQKTNHSSSFSPINDHFKGNGPCSENTHVDIFGVLQFDAHSPGLKKNIVIVKIGMVLASNSTRSCRLFMGHSLESTTLDFRYYVLLK